MEAMVGEARQGEPAKLRYDELGSCVETGRGTGRSVRVVCKSRIPSNVPTSARYSRRRFPEQLNRWARQ